MKVRSPIATIAQLVCGRIAAFYMKIYSLLLAYKGNPVESQGRKA
jgi:hypothetical protein